MKWFFKWFNEKLDSVKYFEDVCEKENSWSNNHNHMLKNSASLSSQAVGDSLDSPAVRFKMFKASGGTIIETTIYDHHKDRHITGLYVITNDKDIGSEIGKILTLESLKV
jgi:hypothetical protein